MKKTIIILDHPNFANSAVNRRWAEEINKYPDEFVIHNLQSAFPRGIIDAHAEHCLIENCGGSIVFQFPLYWYNCPPMTKLWFDKVITSDWAYGSAHKLENVKFGIAVSCGSKKEDYTEQGRHHCSVETYLNSIVHSIEFIGGDYKGLYAYYGANTQEQPNIEQIIDSAKGYVDWLRTIRTEE